MLRHAVSPQANLMTRLQPHDSAAIALEYRIGRFADDDAFGCVAHVSLTGDIQTASSGFLLANAN